jgi:bacterioferritin-associated ferredoxin
VPESARRRLVRQSERFSSTYCERLALSVHPITMIVCICNAIRETEVRQAARDGASCPTSAYRCMGKKPRCGQCFSFARQIITSERASA